MTTITFSLVSHTNAGKTTLARTLLGQDIGEVRDAPHVTEFASMHELIRTAEGDELRLWDTPGFGDSARLVKRLRGRDQPLGWFLSEVWDRWIDRPFWASQRTLQHAQAESDVLLYLVNAAEPPAGAGYVAPEMELLDWIGKPVLVLLNQLGPPRPAAEEAADVAAWRDHLARWPRVHAVLTLDAFARCWVHEVTLMRVAQEALAEGDRADAASAMARLAAAWQAEREITFGHAMQALAESLARTAVAREALDETGSWSERLRRLGAALGQAMNPASGEEARPADAAQARLAKTVDAEVRRSTATLLQLHRLHGSAEGEILGRVAGQFAVHERVPEGMAAMLGGAMTGALTGLTADIATGGLTLGGGMLAGGLLGALGAAGVARGINVVRGTGQSWVAWSGEALHGAMQAALLRYLAVAHFGRGRGNWVKGEAPAHWQALVAAALAARRSEIDALWAGRSQRSDVPDEAQVLATRLRPLLEASARQVLSSLYG